MDRVDRRSVPVSKIGRIKRVAHRADSNRNPRRIDYPRRMHPASPARAGVWSTETFQRLEEHSLEVAIQGCVKPAGNLLRVVAKGPAAPKRPAPGINAPGRSQPRAIWRSASASLRESRLQQSSPNSRHCRCPGYPLADRLNRSIIVLHALNWPIGPLSEQVGLRLLNFRPKRVKRT